MGEKRRMARYQVRLVEITAQRLGWKGTWYRIGQRHFVRQNQGWPATIRERWDALTPGVSGGIAGDDCRLLRGIGPWVACRLFALKHRKAIHGR